jgi:hypothetical protein
MVRTARDKRHDRAWCRRRKRKGIVVPTKEEGESQSKMQSNTDEDNNDDNGNNPTSWIVQPWRLSCCLIWPKRNACRDWSGDDADGDDDTTALSLSDGGGRDDLLWRAS